MLEHFLFAVRKSHSFYRAAHRFAFGRMTSVKPPNVLVYTGKKDPSVFKKAHDQLRSVLHPDKYVIYEMTESQVMVQPWIENIALLLVLCESLEDNIAELFRNYLANDGKLIVSCSEFNMPEIGLSCLPATRKIVDVNYRKELNIKLTHGKFRYNFSSAEVLADDSDGEPVIMMFSGCDQGVLMVSSVQLEESHDKPSHSQLLESILGAIFGLEVSSVAGPKLTPGFIFTRDGRDPNLAIKEVSTEKGSASTKVPLLLDCGEAGLFDKHSYFPNLKAKRFGEVTLFFPVTSSTMTIAEQFFNFGNVVIIAGRQVSGVGRGGNKWLSPEGCAMFTVPLTLNLTSPLGQRLSILQHLASLAVVRGVRKIHGFQNLDLRLKWPNDLYYGNKQKLGGVLVNSSIQGSTVHCSIGIGINTSNEMPTTCINSIIRDYNETTGTTLPELTTEIVIARTLTELELLVDEFMSFGADSFLLSYYKYWLHTDQHITIVSLGKEAVIKGLDEYGFLVVETQDGTLVTLQPDGNRFDIMKNLILSK